MGLDNLSSPINRKERSPVFGEERCNRIGEYFSLVIDVFEYVLGPLHQIANFVARWRAVDVPDELLFHFLAENVLHRHQIDTITSVFQQLNSLSIYTYAVSAHGYNRKWILEPSFQCKHSKLHAHNGVHVWGKIVFVEIAQGRCNWL